MGTFFNQGEYWCEITEHGLTQSKKSKTNQLFVRFVVKGPSAEDDPDNYAPIDGEYERTYYQAVTKATVDKGMVREALSALEFQGSFDDFNAIDSLVGKFIKFRCKHEVYNNGTQERWELGGNAEIQRMDSKEIQKLDRLFGIQTEKPPGNKQPEAVAQPSAPLPDVTDRKAVAAETAGQSDIPF